MGILCVQASGQAIAGAGIEQKSIPAERATANSADRYAGEPFVIERNDREVVESADGTGLEKDSFAVKLQTEAAVKSFSVISATFASSSQKAEWEYVRVHHADGSVVETPVSDSLEMPTQVMQQAPFYSDLKQKQIPVRGLQVGDVLEWSVRLVRTLAEAPGRFWGVAVFSGEDRVALEESFTLRIPKGVAATVWSPKQVVTPTEQDGYRVYRWTSKQLEPTTGPEAEARKDAEKKRILSPEEITDQTDGKLPAVAWTNFPDWAAVGAWYRELEKDRVVPDEKIKAKAAELTQEKTTDEEKIRALYAYVATQIRYIGVALGQGRYQPHMASEVLSNQYGDCKDKHTLFAALLAAAGYKADAVLIGPGMRFNDAVPMPGDFNHVITAVRMGSGASQKTIWLDTTLEIAPYRALLLAERDKEGLRVPMDSPAHLEKTPAELPFAGFESFEAKGAIDADGVAKSRITIKERGDDELLLRAAIRQVSPSQYDQLAQYLMTASGFGGKVTHTAFTPPDKTDDPIEMSFDYDREKPGNDWENYRIVALDLPDQLPVVDEKQPPQLPIDLGTPRSINSRSELALPAGWSAAPPEALHENSPWISFDRVYRVEHGTLIEEKTITILQRKIPPTSWKEYKAFTDKISPGSYPYIQLTRSADKADAPGPPPPVKDDPEAKRLVMEAVSANQQRQPDRADELIKKARAINPEQQFLWSAAAYAAWLRGAMNEAIEDCRKELKLHPNEPGTYTLLADLQGRQGKRDDVEETLRLQLKVLGPNVDVSRELVQMLIEDERFTDAVTVAKTANTADPENARLRWLLGRALMQAGQRESGSALLIAALHSANDPGLLNDIADEFAESGQVTQEVEDAARKAVAQLTAETESWMLTSAGQDVRTMRARSSLLAASWDTLGWTIYVSASGKQPARLAEAEQYLNAAWRNGLNAIVGMHLGALQEALGRPAEALVSYQLARACSVYHMRNGMQELTPLQRDLDVRVARLKKEQSHAALKDPVAAYRDLEKLPAGSFHGQSLVVPYRLLIDASGVESLMAVDTVDGDQGKPDPDRDLPRLREAMKGAWVPSGSKAKLLRSAVLNCHQQTCEAMLTSIFDTR